LEISDYGKKERTQMGGEKKMRRLNQLFSFPSQSTLS
jgi:hypothetical protein